MDYADKMGVRLICAVEPDYPAYLRALDPPPPVISVWGNLNVLNKPCVAIIGSRNASAIGQRFAHSLAAELGQAGYTIVSGLARGIDSAAHKGSPSSVKAQWDTAHQRAISRGETVLFLACPRAWS